MSRLPSGLIAACLLILLAAPASAQNRFNITGSVVDEAGEPLAGATVVVLTKPDSLISKFAIAGRRGGFTMRRVPVGEYVLQVTFVGFVPIRNDIILSDSELDVGALTLVESVAELRELVVSADHIPFTIKKDTLEYNAAAFGTRPNATVEDLLRRLPGVEVEDDGSIKAQGEDVQNVLVDGKEFFGSDPTIATKNLPADAIERVQVYDKQSDMAEFSGVDDGLEEKTINLQLTDDAKRGYFGNITGGFNGDERYDGQANVNKFTPSMQFALLANINNINRQGFAFSDYLSFMGGMQALSMDGGRIGGGIPLGTDINDGFSETLSIGLNASRDFGSDTSIRSSYFLSSIDNLQSRSVQQQQLLGASLSSAVREDSEQRSENLTHRGNLNVHHKVSDGNDLRLRANFSVSNSVLTNGGFRKTLTATGLTQNTSLTNYRSDGDNLGGDAALTWRKKLNSSGLSLVGSFRANLNDADTGGDLSNTIGLYEAGDVVSTDEILQQQRNLGNTFNQTQRLSFSQPIKGQRVLELSAERRQVAEDQEKSIFDDAGGVLTLNQALSSGFDRTYTYYKGGFRFSQNRDKLSFGLGMQVQESTLDGTILARDQVSRGFTHFLPQANIGYDFKQGLNLDLRYRTSTREPSMTELQPFTDNSDPLNIYVGNPELIPEYRHTMNVHFMYFDQFSFVNLFTFFNITYTENKIVRSRTIDEQFKQTVTSVNSTGDDWTVNGQISYGMPIRPLRAKINLSNRTMFTQGLELVNNAENDTRIWRNTVEGRVENRSKDLWDLRGGARFTFNNVDYSLNTNLNQSYVNKTIFGEATWYLGSTWEISSSLNYRLYDQDVFGANDNVAIWEASISKLLMKEKAEIQLVGLDLLNQNVGVNFSNSATYVQEERIRSLGRYIMLKFVYHISDFGRRGGGGIEVHSMGD